MNYRQKIKTLFLMTLFSSGFILYGYSQEEKIGVIDIKNENGNIDFYISNPHPNQYKAEVNFDVLVNYSANIPLPFSGIIEPKTEKKYLFTLTPSSSGSIKYSYSCKFTSIIQVEDNSQGTLPLLTNCTEEKHTSLCIALSEDNSENSDSSLFDYEWVLGDGNTRKGSKIKYCYKDYGEYTIKLNVFDKFTNEYLFNVATEKVTIKKEDGLFFDIPDSAIVNRPVLITNVIADLDNYDNDNIYWNFSDGGKAMGMIESHIFNNVGDYVIKMGVISLTGTEKQCIYKNITIIK